MGNKVRISDKFKPLYTTKKRIIVITGGRRSMKSFAVADFITRLTFEKGHNMLYTRYTMTSAEKSIIPEFREKIDLLNGFDCFDITKTNVFNKITGSNIIFSGIKTSSGNQTASLKSLKNLSTFILDEAEEQKSYEEWETIHLSVSNNQVQNRDIIILNPTTKEHWIWKRWFEGHLKYIKIDGYDIPVSTHPDIEHIHTTYLDNLENLPQSYIDEVLKMKLNEPEKYKHKILGGWLEKAEGVVYTNWEYGDFDDSLPFGFGLDFGYSVDPDACIKVAINEKLKKIYLKEIMYETGQSSDRLRDMLITRCGQFEIIADSAEPRLIDDLKRDVNIKRAYKPPNSVAQGIKILLGYKLIIDPDSDNLTRELNNYAWDDKKSDKPIDAYNHLLDALRYYTFQKLQVNTEKYIHI